MKIRDIGSIAIAVGRNRRSCFTFGIQHHYMILRNSIGDEITVISWADTIFNEIGMLIAYGHWRRRDLKRVGVWTRFVVIDLQYTVSHGSPMDYFRSQTYDVYCQPLQELTEPRSVKPDKICAGARATQ